MSAYIMTDIELSTIAIYINHLNNNIDAYELANKLKAINIASVNYRYNEKTRNSKCKLINNFDNIRHNQNSIITLIRCWSYQSCENENNLDYHIMQGFLYNILDIK